MGKAIATIFILVVGFVVTIIGLSALLALPVMWLWNYVMPDVFGLTTITFLQAWALNILSGMLLKSSNISSSSSSS
jgi:hypothetical protein